MDIIAPANASVLPSPACGGGLIAAIAAIMTDVHSIAKDGVNKFHGYRYATMGNLLREITPLLGRHGVVVFQTETGRAMFDGENVIAVEYAFTVVHISGERWPDVIKQTGVSKCRDSKGGWDDKSLAKCHTAARKYFLLSLFQIPTGEEADADAGENDHTSSPARRRTPSQTIDARYEQVIRADQPPRRVASPAVQRMEDAIAAAFPSPHRTEPVRVRQGPVRVARAAGEPPPYESIPEWADDRRRR
jgi:hypothetical protein